jgi:hypothetical protein
MLSTETTAREAELSLAFRSAQPFRHVVIDNYLDAGFCGQLLEQFPSFDTRFALNEMGEVGGKAVRTAVRDLSEAYRQADDWVRSQAFLDHVSRITGIPDLLYDPDYEGGGTHENRQGQELAAHIDFNYHPRTGWHRRLNLIVYLNPDWESDWGGCLELHSDPWDAARNQSQAVLPLFNRCVVFETNEVSWHGFSRIRLPQERQDLSRKSFAIYLYTRERPADETAPPHATVYVPDGMPEHLAAGARLQDEDIDELRGRFAGLRGQLRFLYEREKQFTAQIARLEGALAEARAALRPDVEGYAKVGSAQGYWPDGWCAREFSFEFKPTRDVRQVELEVWAPPGVDADQVLVVEIGGQRFETAVGAGRNRRCAWSIRLRAGTSVPVRIISSTTWRPASNTDSGDERELAFKLLAFRVHH